MLTVTERKKLTSLLVQLFSYPDPDLVSRLAEAETAFLSRRLAVPSLLPSVTDWTDLEPAFTSLFINRLGGVPAPPYGSIYLDDDARMMGPSALRVAHFYQRAGLTFDTLEPPDFLATELEFLYYLAECEGENPEEESSSVSGEFFNDLFLPWVAPFCTRLTAAEPHPLYLWGATLLQAFARQEKVRLQALEQSVP